MCTPGPELVSGGEAGPAVDGDGDRVAGERFLGDAVEAYEAGDFNGCLRSAQDAAAIFERLGDHPRAVAALQRQAMAWAVSGDLGAAVDLNRRLIAHYTQLGDDIGAAKCLTNLGYNLRLLARHEEGLRAYTDALDVFRRYPERAFERATLHMNLAAAYRGSGVLGRAYAHAACGAQLFRRLPGHEARVIDCLMAMAGMLDRLDHPDRAMDVRRQAEAVATRLGDPVRLGTVRHGRGASLARRGLFVEALAEERAALWQLLHGPDLNIHTAQELLRNVTRLYAQTGRPAAGRPFALLAAHLVARTLSGLRQPSTRAAWRRRHAEIFDTACSLAADADDGPLVAVLVEMARAQQPIVGETSPYDLLLGASADPDPSLPLGPLQGLCVGAVRLDADELIDAVLADLAGDECPGVDPGRVLRRLAAPAGSSASIDLAVLTRRLGGPDGVLWGTIQLRSTIYWYVLDSSGCRAGRLDAADGTPLATALGDLAAALPDHDEYAARVARGAEVMDDGAGRNLAALLLPARLRLQWTRAATAGRPCRLLIVPAATVARYPLGALPLGPGGEPLAEWLIPVYVPSPALARAASGSLLPGNEASSPSKGSSSRSVALVVADPMGDLPGARRLARLGAVSLCGEQATQDAVARRLAEIVRTSDGADTWVYAGHTTALEDGVSPALRLADVEVTAAEWLTTRGRSRLPAPPRVVLVSCGSAGLGPVDWYGLATAALCAGATTAVCSLWPHPDALWSIDQRIVIAVAQARDVAAAVHATLAVVRSPEGPPVARSPFVWGNYIVISHEPVEQMIDHYGRDV